MRVALPRRLLIAAIAVAGVTGCGSPSTAPAATSAAPPAAAPVATDVGSPSPSAPAASAAPTPAGPPGAAPTTSNSSATAAPNGSAPPDAAPAPRAPAFREVTVPAGTTLAIELKTALTSATAAVEDPVEGVLRRAVVIDGLEVVPAGAALGGSVTAADRAGRVKGRAHLALRFTTLAANDEGLPIATAAISRDARTTKRRDAAKVGIGAGAGALVGAIVGGKKGAVVGGTVGAGAGTGVVLATRGEEVELGVGANLTTTLTRPLVVRVPQ